MFGFAQFAGGFTLEDATTSCTFSSSFPISGPINMNGGTLYLQQNMLITSSAQIEGLGNIIGNNHTLEFGHTITSLPANLKLIKDVNVILNNSVDIISSVTVQGQCSLYARGNTINLKNDSGFIIDSNSSLKIQYGILRNIDSNTICIDDTSHLILNNAFIDIYNDWTFNKGDITIQNNVTFWSSKIFDYQSNVPLVITDGANFILDGGITYKAGKVNPGDCDPLLFFDNSSLLSCNNCNFIITGSGITLLKGQVALNGTVTIDIESTDTSYGLIFGNNNSADDFLININPGSHTEVIKGALTYNNALSNGFQSTNPSAVFALDTAAILNIATTCTFPQNTLLLQYDGISLPTIIVAPGKTIYANHTRFFVPGITDVTCAAHTNDGYTFILDDYDYLYLSNGLIPLPITIQGSNTTIAGNGRLDSTITLSNSSSSLILSLQGSVNGPIDLNGGTVILNNDIVLTSTNYFASSGTINIQNHAVTISPHTSQLIANEITWIGNYGAINYNDELTLTGTRTFVGNITLNGNGNAFTFDKGILIIAPASHLTLKDVQVNEIVPNSIYCMDNTGTLTLDNVIWAQAGNFDFSKGMLEFKRINQIIGPHIFAYTSIVPSRIENNSTLFLNGGITFTLGRSSDTEPAPLLFSGRNSALSMANCSMVITPSGVSFTKGQIQLNGYVTIDIQSTDTTYGLIIGDNNSSDNDAFVYINPGSYTHITNGAITYNNVLGDGFKSTSPSSVVNLHIGSTLHIATTCTFPQNTLQLEYDGISLPTISVEPGKTIFSDNTRVLVTGITDATYLAQTNDGFNFILKNGNSIYISSGLIESELNIQGSNVAITGNGIIDNTITFSHSSASMILTLQGAVNYPIDLNGATLILNNNVSLNSSPICSSDGTINLQSHIMTLNPATPLEISTALTWSGNNGMISFNQDLTLSNTQTVVGNVVWEGNGNTLHFYPSGSIVVSPNTQLTLKNMNITNIGSASIYCIDDTGSIVLDNVRWVQSDDYEFTQGALVFSDAVLMSGQNKVFTYSSTQTSTILANSTVTLDNLFTFSYAPSNNSTTLLEFTDFTSVLALRHIQFYAIPGLELTKGQLAFSQAPTLYALGNGITLGDDVTTTSDMHMVFLDNSTLTLAQGQLIYKNLDSNAIQLWNANLISFAPTTTLTLYENMYIQSGEIKFGSNDTPATYEHMYATCCTTTTEIIGGWGGNWTEVCFCS
jgi:acetyltransferase-like isoleucine patch superfamily enzyme